MAGDIIIVIIMILLLSFITGIFLKEFNGK